MGTTVNHVQLTKKEKLTMPSACMVSACICQYVACDMGDIVVLCKGNQEYLCCVEEMCCVAGEAQKGCGPAEKKDGEICRLALPCCATAIKKPALCCAGAGVRWVCVRRHSLSERTCIFAGSCLCFYGAGACPLNEEYVPTTVCALYCLQCAPKCGCCQPPPDCKVLNKPKGSPGGAPPAIEMTR